MVSKLHNWQNECRMIGTKITCLDSDIEVKNSGLFQACTGYYCGNTFVSNHPRYFVWVDDVMIKSTSNYTEAYSVWKNRGVEISQVCAPAQMAG